MLSAVMANSQSRAFVKDLAGRYLIAHAPFLLAFGVQEDELRGRTEDFLDPQLAPGWRRTTCGRSASSTRSRSGPFPERRRHYESVKFPLYDPDGAVSRRAGSDSTRRTGGAPSPTSRRRATRRSRPRRRKIGLPRDHEPRHPDADECRHLDDRADAAHGPGLPAAGTRLHSPQQRGFAADDHQHILDFSKIEAGDLELEEQPFEVADCVESALALVAFGTQDKELELVADLDTSGPPMVVGDVTRFRRVIVTCFPNAVKFTASGDVVVV